VRTHSNASVTHREANVAFLRRTVDVNHARICVCGLRIAATQPKNTRNDWITSWRIWCNDLARAASILKDSARWCVIANFLRDLQFTQWSTRAARPIAEAKFGCGHRIDSHQVTAIKKCQLLFAGADNDAMPGIGRGARSDDGGNRAEKDCAAVDIDLHRLNLKNFSAVSVVASPTSSNRMPRAAAIVSATMRVCAGSQRFPRNGTGARYGQSVSTMNFQSGTPVATSRTFAPFSNVTTPGNETR